ncbi:penicillin acylase family protein [Anaerobacillus isosaccharinicus]|uniref:Penicillin acylase family protein n=1 Tax=Anaerobacillus isosaccharinicus TaxID=1532552 RepID=A0A1S2MEK8_9BACI|nr:penicillin acylase family protein [Anaerobacillus isosaccharinicus]MBA5584666.1 penicillin acylase family protein [Anaerobacillus isosaccharinicus]QOY36961.1 penicillin acylase family protein [Anaerobacillus isosaccharinicus]
METTVVAHKQPLLKRKWVKISVWILCSLLFFLTLAVGLGYWFVKRSHPGLTGTVIAQPLNSEVTVIRDERGVAQIKAVSLEDLFFVQGYVTAQDRLYQMDMTRRLASGRLSEVVGKQALETDRFFRTYGMHRTTDRLVSMFNEETTRIVDAYVSGVNQYIEEAFSSGKYPIEFRILGYEPNPWTKEDTALVVKYMGYTLSGNFRAELEHYRMIKKLGHIDAPRLFPEYHIDDAFPTIYTVSEASPFSLTELENLTTFAPDEFNGSNNWVIGGDYTESGFPFVADDPHLGFAIPSVWYQTHLQLDGDFHSVGVTVPGVPGVVLGHNEHMAWGVTALSVDQEDLFLEKAHPQNPQLYLFDDIWEEATIIEEVIEIKDEEPFIERVEVTRNGPIINKVVTNGPYQAISLRWTGYEAGEELNGIMRLNRATNVHEFTEGLNGFVTPALSWVYADRDGNIGFRGQALMPIRNNSNGMLPVPGWDPDYQWQGFIPNEELPQIINPERGYIMTANNKPVDDEYPYEIGRSFYPYRAERLTELIEDTIASDELFTIEKMKEMQTDVLNVQARSLLPILLDAVSRSEIITPLSGLEKDVYDMLRDWDYQEKVDSGGALAWNHWYNLLGPALFDDLLGFSYNHNLVIYQVLQEAHQHPDHQLFGSLRDGLQLSLDELARETFAAAIDGIVDIQGKNTSKWAWGKWHTLTIDHPLGAVKPLHLLFNVGKWEIGGSGATPNANAYNRHSGKVTGGAGWRFVADLASVNSMYDIVMPGQSGQVFSPHYSDQVDTWAEGNLYPMVYHKDGLKKKKLVRFVPGE